MYKMNLNNWHLKPKNSIIYTPKEVSEFLFNLLHPLFPQKSLIFDPCSGQGSLLAPWKKAGYRTYGNDIDTNLLRQGFADADHDFLQNWEKSYSWSPQLILCNPPFNGYGNRLGSEVWFDKILELFGKELPIVLFVPMGFRLNSRREGRRWKKFINEVYPPISSLISLPRDIFSSVEFHSEILIFNIKGLKPHYFFRLPKAQ